MISITGDRSVITTASNLAYKENPPYALSDFYKMYAMFEGKVDEEIIQMYIDFAMVSVQESRFGSAWKLAMGYFIAHFCALYLMSYASPESTAAQVISLSQAKGLVSSKSAGDVSVSYDFGTLLADLDGWAQWKLTNYGIQYASLARMIGKGAMLIW